MSECVTGYIDHVIFRNEDNGYTVFVMKGVKGYPMLYLRLSAKMDLIISGTINMLRSQNK